MEFKQMKVDSYSAASSLEEPCLPFDSLDKLPNAGALLPSSQDVWAPYKRFDCAPLETYSTCTTKFDGITLPGWALSNPGSNNCNNFEGTLEADDFSENSSCQQFSENDSSASDMEYYDESDDDLTDSCDQTPSSDEESEKCEESRSQDTQTRNVPPGVKMRNLIHQEPTVSFYQQQKFNHFERVRSTSIELEKA